MIYGKVFKVKKGQLSAWKEWCNELGNSLYKEAQSTLVEEGVLREVTGTFAINEEHYVLGFMDVPENSSPGSSDKSKDINKKHQKMKQRCLEPVSSFEVLSDISSRG